jgi:hypothetical protein
MGKRHPVIPFHNPDGSQNGYFIDTLHVDSILIVQSVKNKHFYAVIKPSKIKLKGKIWEKPETYLFDYSDPLSGWVFYGMSILEELPNDMGDEQDYLHPIDSPLNTEQYKVVMNVIKPKYYWLVMIRGDAYNFLTVYTVLDGSCKPIKFKDPKAYYKLLVPVW